MDIGQWLNAIGLGQYETLFREHEIDTDVLIDLTEADLEKIGVPLGQRKRLMRAITALAADGAPPAAKPAPTQRPPPPPAARADAERRPITVMFCDLVGSTNLAARLDAEDWRNLVGAYLDEASAAVTSMGGHVLKKLGDGLMALFGYPQAQENDAERAVRAALAIQRALAELNTRNAGKNLPQLAARIGIESGQVVVDAAGEVFGEAPNVAARVQAAAEPGTVLVTASVQRQTAGLFVAEDKGAYQLKGVPAPVALYRIVRASGAGRRGGARALTPLVGREDELALLTRRWSRALAGEGQFVQIVGEPGIGKSRLIQEFRAKLAETPHTWVEWAASQLLQNTPLHPLAEWGRLRYGGPDASDEQKLADLENTLRLIGLDAAEYAPLLAPLFDVALPDNRAAKFAPEELRRRQLAAMTALFLAGARSQPVVLAFEDLHWADPTSLDLLRALVERGAQAPLLIVATTRPEFRPDWSLRSHHSVISLAPLDRAQVRKMVGEIANRHALSDETIDGVGERTGGVPLFVEEVTRLLLERDAQGGAQAIPPTLQQSLAARLDRLGEAREVAQIGAVLGRDFSFRLLSDVSSSAAGFDELRLRAALDRLTEADLLFVDGAPPAAAYRFKHALIQDAAYESLLKSRRQALHRRAAEALRDADAEPEAIAHHFTEAGLDDLAIEWWGKAGDQALRRSAFQEAIAHLDKAIAMADKAGKTSRRAPGRVAGGNQRLTQLNAAYGNALIAARGHGAPETIEAFARARKSASEDEDAPGRFAADYGLWVGSYVRGDLPSMRTHAAAFLAGVAASPDSPEAGVAHRVLGTTHCFAGEYAEAREHLERALTLFQPGRDDDLAFRFGQDAGVAAMVYLALASWPLGNVRRAVSLVDGAHERLASVAHIGTHPYAKLHAAMFELMRGDRARAAENGSEAARLAREHDLPLWRAYGAFFEGLAMAERGALGEGLSDMRRCAESLRQQGLLNFDGLFKIALAEAEARAGDRDRAIAILDEALATADSLDYRAFEAELNRTRGEILLKGDPANPAPAEDAFLTAIAVATRQGTRSFGLRAALALAKLYQSTGRPADAHAVLAPALEGFAPTPEMPEIAEAEALLAGLAESDEVKAEAASRRLRFQLQAGYRTALAWTRGVAAEETQAAAAHTDELAAKLNEPAARFALYPARFFASLISGQTGSAQSTAETYLSEARNASALPDVALASILLAEARMVQGGFADARTYLEEALDIYDRARGMKFESIDWTVYGTLVLAAVCRHSGAPVRARELIEQAKTRVDESPHGVTFAITYTWTPFIEALRGDARAALRDAETLGEISAKLGLPLSSGVAKIYRGWAHARLEDRPGGLKEMREGLAQVGEQKALVGVPFYRGLLAELEAEGPSADRALTQIDEALALAEQTGQTETDALLHRIRGDILLKADPKNPALAEEAYLAAATIAREQGARSFGLQAALKLAKLYQSTGRPVEAHAVLAPALDGFSPTSEMPEIAEAQALLAALADSEEVKTAVAQRDRRLRLQTAYGQAMMYSKGFAADETKAAFVRAAELAANSDDFSERFAAFHGQWTLALARGELKSARELASTFLREAEAAGRMVEAGVARRGLALMSYFAGDFAEARIHCERALENCGQGRDREPQESLGEDTGLTAMSCLAATMWQLGEVDRARELIEAANRRAAELGHVPSMAHPLRFKSYLENLRGDAAAALTAAEALEALSREHGMNNWRAVAELCVVWARGRLDDPSAGAAELQRALAEVNVRGNSLSGSWFVIAQLAQFELQTLGAGGALARIDEALALASQVEVHCDLPFAHLLRGEILLMLEPANPALAEEAFGTALAIARQQCARSWGLRAALSLARLHQSTGRPADALGVLAPALEGFSPTPELPEIAEAQALLTGLMQAMT